MEEQAMQTQNSLPLQSFIPSFVGFMTTRYLVNLYGWTAIPAYFLTTEITKELLEKLPQLAEKTADFPAINYPMVDSFSSVNYKIIHQTKARIRLYIPQLIKNSSYSQWLEKQLMKSQDIVSYRINYDNQNLILYGNRMTSWDKIEVDRLLIPQNSTFTEEVAPATIPSKLEETTISLSLPNVVFPEVTTQDSQTEEISLLASFTDETITTEDIPSISSNNSDNFEPSWELETDYFPAQVLEKISHSHPLSSSLLESSLSSEEITDTNSDNESQTTEDLNSNNNPEEDSSSSFSWSNFKSSALGFILNRIVELS